MASYLAVVVVAAKALFYLNTGNMLYVVKLMIII